MSRLTRAKGRAAGERPASWKLLLRRWRRALLRLALTGGVLGALVVLVIALRGHDPGGHDRGGHDPGGHDPGGHDSGGHDSGGYDSGGDSLAPRAAWADALSARLGLRVRTVVVEGRGNTPEPLLRAAIGVAPGDPILGVSLAGMRARLESLAWVQQATVERHLPGTLVIRLAERRPFAVWQTQGRFALIDRAGREVADEGVANFKTLPLVVGADAPAHAAAILDLLDRYPEIRARLAALVRIGGRRWNLRLANGADVLLPEGHEAEALARLAALQTDHALLDRPFAAVDLRAPDRLILRPRPEAKPEGESGKAPPVPHGEAAAPGKPT